MPKDIIEWISPVAYQGSKQRFAKEIIDIIDPKDCYFYDLCCGSGSISIELVKRGFDKNYIYMLDAGTFGLFWKLIGQGEFPISTLEYYCNQVPKDQNKIQSFAKELSKTPADVDTVCIYLILQANSFGGKAIFVKDNKWKNTSFRSYWEPTETSNRRSVVLAMHPFPNILVERVKFLADKMVGVNVIHNDIFSLLPQNDSIMYIDPPYKDTTGYGFDFSLEEFLDKFKAKQEIYVSEARILSEKYWELLGNTKKGSISGEKKVKPHQEYLSLIDG